MTNIFLKIVEMSVSASVIALVVILLRFFLKKSPKRLCVLLWVLVALRLILPFSIESMFSLMPKTSPQVPLNYHLNYQEFEEIQDFNEVVGIPILPEVNETFEPTVTNQKESFDIISLLSFVWIAGVILLTVYMTVSSLLVYRKIKFAISLKDNIYISDSISSPFVFGFIKPKIYLPDSLEENHFEHIIAHEKAHIRRLDHIIKPLGFLILSLHWFNPLMWLSYILFCRDIEFACDENVVKKLTPIERTDYSQALLDCSIKGKILTVYPTAFGEVGVKSRIKSVLSYKKPTVWIILIALLAVIITAVCFLTDPEKEGEKPENDEPALEEEFEGIPENVVRFADEIGMSLIDKNWGVFSSTVLSLEKVISQKNVSTSENSITLYKMVYWISPTIETPGNTDNFTTHTIYFAVEENSGNYTNLGWIFEKELEETYAKNPDTNAFMNALTGIYNEYMKNTSKEITLCKDKDYSVTLRNVNDIFEASPKKQISEFISALCLGDKEIVDIYIGGSIENFDSIKMDAYATLTDNYTTALVYLDVQRSESPAFPEGQYQYLLKLNESPYLSVIDFFGKMEKYALYNATISAYYTSDPLLDDALRFTYQDLIRLGDYSENIENHAFHIMQHSLPNAEDGYSDYETIEKYFFDRFGIEVNKSYSIKRELDGKKTVIDGEEKYMVGCAHGADASANIFEKIEQNGNKYSISFIFHSDFAYISESERRIFTFEKVEGSDILRFIKFESEKLSNEKTAGYSF